MTVYAVMRIRQGVPYEDPGADEVVSLHLAEESAAAIVTEQSAKYAAVGAASGINWYDDEYEVRAFEVLP